MAIELANHIYRDGEGVPVVLMNAYPVDHRMWDVCAKALADFADLNDVPDFPIWAPDMAGSGASPVPSDADSGPRMANGAYSEALDRLAGAYVDLIKAAGYEQAIWVGLSMGGYGALKCALTYPERYAGVGSFSGVVDIRRPVYSVKTPAGAREREAIFGAGSPEGTKNDLYRLAQDVFDEKKSFPDIYLSCGEQDGLYEDNVKFDAFLTTLGAKHRFDHRAGAHSWRFWNDSVEECFGYFLGK